MADYRINVTAETREAERKLAEVDKAAEKATKGRSIKVDANFIGNATQGFKDLQNNLKEAANNVQTFYRVSKAIPGVGDRVREFEELARNTAQTSKEQFALGASLKENAKAGAILSNSLEVAAGAGGRLISALAKIGFATFALKEAVGVLQAAWTGFFNNTIGREIKLRETILKTQTTLASTNKVFKDGAEITDPYQKIVQLTSAVNKNIDSIRERSIALAGVTSNDVIEVFGIVAGQIGQIGGGLKEAEDLAINFAAALGTFGIPLYQARQEIGSILRGDITMDSYLAKSLGITNEDIAKAKSQVGGVVKFLEERLAAAVAGQRIAAQGFSGVISNIADLGELIGQNFGRGLLDPLLAGLTAVFESLFGIRQQIFDIAAGAGKAIGRTGQLLIGLTAGRTGIGRGDPSKAAEAASNVASRVFTELEAIAQRTVGAITRTIEALRPTVLILADAFRNVGEAFVSIKVGTFEALASAISNIASVVGTIAPALATVFNLYARFLNTDAVRYFSEVAAVLGLLKRVGLDAATQLVLFGRFIVGAVVPAVGVLGTALAGLVGAIAAIVLAVGKLLLVFAGLATALVGPAAAIPALAVGLRALAAELLNVGNQATGAGGRLGALATGFKGLAAGAKASGFAILASLGWIAAIQIGISVLVDAIGRYQRAQEDKRASERAQEALRRLQTTYKDVGDSADSATKAARDFEEAIVNANYNRNVEQLEELRKKINQIRYELKPGIQSWGEFWDALSGSEVGRFEERSRKILEGLLKDEERVKAQLRGVDALRDRERAQENLRLEAQNRTNLEREIGEIRRQQDEQLFQLRQQRAQKEVEIFRLAGELRIFQMEQANKKLIEGEEGASAAALDALNNYLSIRERGELDIESAKKELVIEAANLERQVANYRLDNERRIAEIRKRANINDQNMAQYRLQMARDTARALTTDPNPNASQDFRTRYLMRMSNLEGGYGINGSAARNPTSNARGYFQLIPSTERDLRSRGRGDIADRFLSRDFNTAASGAYDYATMIHPIARQLFAQGDVAGLDRLLNRLWTSLPGGAEAATGERLARGNVYLTGGAAAAPPQAPTLPPQQLGFDDIGAPAVAKYAEAVASLAGAMERARALQAALTDAKTAAAFEEIARVAFPKVAVEQYQDQMAELVSTYESWNSGSSSNAELIGISAETISKIYAANRELRQIATGAANNINLSEAERIQLLEQLNVKYQAYIKGLKEEESYKKRIALEQMAINALQNTRGRLQSMDEELALIQLRNRLEMEGVSPERIQAEEAKLRVRQELARNITELNRSLEEQLRLSEELRAALTEAAPENKADLQYQLQEASTEIARLRKRIKDLTTGATNEQTAIDRNAAASQLDSLQGLFNRWRREIKDFRQMITDLAQTIQGSLASALDQTFTALVDGTVSVKDAVGDMLRNIANSFLQMATQIISKMIVMYLFKRLLSFWGGDVAAVDVGASTAVTPFAKGGIVDSPTVFKFASGGTFSTGVMGEAGPEAIIPLKRKANGDLGIEAPVGSDGGTYNVTVNVDASGTQAQGDDQRATQLGRLISTAVQNEIVRQKRPGGILA